MKKLLIVLLALTVVGVLAFAQDAPAASLSVGAWGRMWFSPVAVDVQADGTATDPFVKTGPDWANGGRVGVSFTGTSENVGFTLNPGFNGGSWSPACDQAKIWVKINPMITVNVGKIQGDTLRGKFDDYGDMLPISGKDAIFARFNPQLGILLDITPAEGLYIGAALDSSTPVYNWDLSSDSSLADIVKAAADKATFAPAYSDYLKAIQVGAGYTIANVGLIRAQYIGEGGPMAGSWALSKGEAADIPGTAKGDVVAATGYFQAAFAYTGLEGVLVDAGFRLPTNADFQYLGAVGVSYSKDALSATARGDVSFGGDSDIYELSGNASAQVVYAVAAPYALGAEVAFSGMPSKFTDKDASAVDVYPFVKLGYGSGKLQVGFDAKVSLVGNDLGYQVPILLEYSF